MVQFSVPPQGDFPAGAVEIFALRVHFAWMILKIVLLSCCKERLFLWCRLKLTSLYRFLLLNIDKLIKGV